MQGIMLILVGILLVFSSETMQAAQRAAMVFAGNVMPALFPMMVLGSLIAARMPAAVSRTGTWIFQIMFGFCAGSPASARQLTAQDQQQNLTPWEYRTLLCMSGVMSPMFFTGTLAARMGSRVAWLMLGCHWLSALLTGGFCAVLTQRLHKTASREFLQQSLKDKETDKTASRSTEPSTFHKIPEQPSAKRQSLRPLPFSAALTAAISNAALAQLSILGAMMLFSILSAILRALLEVLFPVWTAAHESWLAVLWSLMEIGGGALAVLDSIPAAPPWLLCALCSFGGLSIWLQNQLFLGAKTHPAELLGWRMLHGVIAGIVCYCFDQWLGIGALSASAIALQTPSAGIIPAASIPSWLSLLLLVILAVLPRRAEPSA